MLQTSTIKIKIRDNLTEMKQTTYQINLLKEEANLVEEEEEEEVVDGTATVESNVKYVEEMDIQQ